MRERRETLTDLAGLVDGSSLAKLRTRLADIDGFDEQYAVDGLYIAGGLRDAVGGLDTDDVETVGLVVAFWAWIDDRADRAPSSAGDPIDWLSLIGQADTRTPRSAPRQPEEVFLARVAAALTRRARHPDDLAWWWASAATALRAMRREQQPELTADAPTYTEALEIATDSSTFVNLLAAGYLVGGLPRASRGLDLELPRLERLAALYSRLVNDLESAAKERLEGGGAGAFNTVLLLEPELGPANAVSFVSRQAQGALRLIERTRDLLDEHDPYARLVLHLVERVRSWYAADPERLAVRETA